MQFCRSPIDKGGHMKPYIGYACSIVSLVFVLTSCSGGGGGGGSGGGSTDTTPPDIITGFTTPTSLTVPATDTDGAYSVSWTPSDGTDVIYFVEEQPPAPSPERACAPSIPELICLSLLPAVPQIPPTIIGCVPGRRGQLTPPGVQVIMAAWSCPRTPLLLSI